MASKEEEYFNCSLSYSAVFAPTVQVDSTGGSQTSIKHVLILPRKFCEELVANAQIRGKIKAGNGCVSDNGNGIEIDIRKWKNDEVKFVETLEMACQNDSVAYVNTDKGAFKIKFNKAIAKEIERIDNSVESQNKKIGYLLRPDVLPKLNQELEIEYQRKFGP